MAQLNAAEQNIASGLRRYPSLQAIQKHRGEFHSLARDLGVLTRPAIVRVGLESCKDDMKPGFSPYERFATLISASKQLSEQTPSMTAWAWDQIGRTKGTDQVDFSRAVSVFQSQNKEAIVLNLARTHSMWNTVLERDNLGLELSSLLAGVPKDAHAQMANWFFWAAHAMDGHPTDPLSHEAHHFSVYLRDRITRFNNGYETIGGLCNFVDKLGRTVTRNAQRVMDSEATPEERSYASSVEKSVSHAMDIAQTYRKLLPTEILVYASGPEDAANIKEAVTCLFREDDPAEAFGKAMRRAHTRAMCPNGSQIVPRWHAFFDELTAQKEEHGLALSDFREDPIVGSYLTLRDL